jgi:tetrahydrodipicolinate N-succinyltransferase
MRAGRRAAAGDKFLAIPPAIAYNGRREGAGFAAQRNGDSMDAKEIIEYIRSAQKKTPVKVYLKEKKEIPFENCRVFGVGDKIVFGDWADIERALKAHEADVADWVVESDCRNSAIPLLDTKDINARIEPGAIIREQVEIGPGAESNCKRV